MHDLREMELVLRRCCPLSVHGALAVDVVDVDSPDVGEQLERGLLVRRRVDVAAVEGELFLGEGVPQREARSCIPGAVHATA